MTLDRSYMAYVIKAEVPNPSADSFVFPSQKTMYGGKRIAAGDEVFVFASENEGGTGLVCAGVVTAAAAVARVAGIERQTPRVSIEVRRTASAARPLGRRELKPFAGAAEELPQAELHFKFYRQATNKIAGISSTTAAFLRGYCRSDAPVEQRRARPPAAERIGAADAADL